MVICQTIAIIFFYLGLLELSVFLFYFFAARVILTHNIICTKCHLLMQSTLNVLQNADVEPET